MKRKTFIKQAMAAGIPRNTAALAAQDAAQRGEPYFFALGRLLNFLAIMRDEVNKAVTKAALCGRPVTIANKAMDIFYPWLCERPEDIRGGGAK